MDAEATQGGSRLEGPGKGQRPRELIGEDANEEGDADLDVGMLGKD